MLENSPGKTNSLSSFLWGLAEATFFFIVPDVLISFFALKRTRLAVISATWALAGALIGGTIIYHLGLEHYESTYQVFENIPAIDANLIDGVEKQIQRNDVLAIFEGPFRGTPYKIYTLQAANMGIPFGIFFIVSLVARYARFLLIGLIVGMTFEIMNIPQKKKVFLLSSLWILFYSWYFWAFP